MELYEGAEKETVVHAFARAVAAFPDDLFLNIAGERFSYAEVDRAATRLAHELAALGVVKGDRVVTLTETNVDVVPLWLAINRIGAIWVPINTAYRGDFLRHQIADAGACLAICDEDYLARIVDIAADLPALRLVLSRGAGPYPACAVPVEPLDAHRGTDEAPIPIDVTPQDLACLIYTSGTTGPSKGCMVSHAYLCNQGRQHRQALPQARGEIGWTCLPMFHTAGITHVLAAMLDGHGAALWPFFSVSQFWDHIEASGASHALLMATIFGLVANAPDTPAMKRCHGQLKAIIGVPIPPDIKAIWEQRFGVGYCMPYAYGQTEANRMSSLTFGDPEPLPGSAGRPTDAFVLAILDDSGNVLPEGEVGEIAVRPRRPGVMFDGYWNRPEETVKAWRNLWMHTGDLGRMEQGCLFFVDRKKDYLRCRGENVSSFEIERAFQAHPAIRESAVHAVGQQSGEDEIKITIVPKDDADPDPRELCEWAIGQLPHFAVPRYFEFRAELPKNPTGRVLKYQLRDEGVTTATWDREAHGITVRKQRRPAA